LAWEMLPHTILLIKPDLLCRKEEREKRIRKTTLPASPERERWRAGDEHE